MSHRNVVGLFSRQSHRCARCDIRYVIRANDVWRFVGSGRTQFPPGVGKNVARPPEIEMFVQISFIITRSSSDLVTRRNPTCWNTLKRRWKHAYPPRRPPSTSQFENTRWKLPPFCSCMNSTSRILHAAHHIQLGGGGSNNSSSNHSTEEIFVDVRVRSDNAVIQDYTRSTNNNRNASRRSVFKRHFTYASQH